MSMGEPADSSRERCSYHPNKFIYRTKAEASDAALAMMHREDLPFSAYRGNHCEQWHVGKPRFGDDTYPDALARWMIWNGKTVVSRPLTMAERKKARNVADIMVRIQAAQRTPDPEVRYELMALRVLLPGADLRVS